jgi:3-methyladenine DNA glycosylase AlkD
MYQKIIKEIKSFSDEKYKTWITPLLKNNTNDVILGVRVPILRKLAKKYSSNIDLEVLTKLLHSEFHEVREFALFVMLIKSKETPQLMCDLYLKNLKYINNWDLIDYTAPYIIAPVVSKEQLLTLANSNDLWSNRVAMVATIYYIKQKKYELTLDLAKKYMKHSHHLMHKAAGWMLREVGKQDLVVLKSFLEKYESSMPAVMRSYAKERIK